jgi:hypothetical protein
MHRTLLAALVVALAPAWAAAVEPKKPDYFPLAKGHMWEYAGEFGDNKVSVTATVTALRAEAGKVTATRALVLTMVDQTREVEEELAADPAGVYGSPIFDVKSDPKVTLLKLPAKPRDAWTEKAKMGRAEVLVTSSVKEPVEVKVPAGTFTALPVETGLLAEGEALGITTWYADGVGMVKQKAVVGANTLTLQLKKFTPGK